MIVLSIYILYILYTLNNTSDILLQWLGKKYEPIYVI